MRDSARKNDDQSRRSGEIRGAQVRARLRHAARLVADPVGARQLHVALARVDAVLGHHQRAAGAVAPQRGEQARVAGRDRVVAARLHRRRREQAQHRREDRAVVPEQIQERRVGRDPLRDRRQQLEARSGRAAARAASDRCRPAPPARPGRPRPRRACARGRPARATASGARPSATRSERICSRSAARPAPSSGASAAS